MIRRFCIILSLVFAVGCATNPVTGKRELALISEADELRIGQKNYPLSRQAQGGDYVTDRQLTKYVASVGHRLAQGSDRAGLPYEFVVLNNSTPNAWALPGGKIAINRGLLIELGSEAELAAVLSHEIVHVAARHTVRQMSRNMLFQLGTAGVAMAAKGHKDGNLAVGSAATATGLTMLKYSRDHELEADEYGIKYMSRANYDPQAAVQLQETFVRLKDGKKSGWIEGLFSTHPPSQARVEANRRTAVAYGGSTIGRERYKKGIRVLTDNQEAYAAFDTGVKALSKKQTDKALSSARAAIKAFPQEAHFHALLGDVHFARKKYRAALESYEHAIQRNDRYYRYYLQRGLVRKHVGDAGGARSDLETSVAMLPTAAAHSALGFLDMDGGRDKSAIEHFRIAATAKSDTGQRALRELTRLELPDNPGPYFDIAVSRSKSGHLFVTLRNKCELPVERVLVELTWVPPGQHSRERAWVRFNNRLVPGGMMKQEAGIPLITDKKVAQSIQARVVKAQLVRPRPRRRR